TSPCSRARRAPAGPLALGFWSVRGFPAGQPTGRAPQPHRPSADPKTADHDTPTRGTLVNLRALTKGDAAVAGAAVLLFSASFLRYWTVECKGKYCGDTSTNAWDSVLFPVLPSVFLLGILAAALILVQRFQGQAAANRQILGLRLDQWGIAFSV